MLLIFDSVTYARLISAAVVLLNQRIGSTVALQKSIAYHPGFVYVNDFFGKIGVTKNSNEPMKAKNLRIFVALSQKLEETE